MRRGREGGEGGGEGEGEGEGGIKLTKQVMELFLALLCNVSHVRRAAAAWAAGAHGDVLRCWKLIAGGGTEIETGTQSGLWKWAEVYYGRVGP